MLCITPAMRVRAQKRDDLSANTVRPVPGGTGKRFGGQRARFLPNPYGAWFCGREPRSVCACEAAQRSGSTAGPALRTFRGATLRPGAALRNQASRPGLPWISRLASHPAKPTPRAARVMQSIPSACSHSRKQGENMPLVRIGVSGAGQTPAAQASFVLSISLTWAGLALPLLAFMI